MSWDGFCRNLTNKLIHVFTSRAEMNNNTTHADAGHADSIPTEQLPTIWMRLPFIGKHGNILTKKFTKKTRRLLKGPCKFVITGEQQITTVSCHARIKHLMNTKAQWFTNFHARVAVALTLVKQTGVYTHA